MTIFPVILSGGVGSRLWPSSREAYPKQLHQLVSDRSMIQETVLRVGAAVAARPVPPALAGPIVVCNAAHIDAINAQLDAVGVRPLAMIAEPEGRNTAPAAALAAAVARETDPKAILLILPADHHILDVAAFGEAIERAVLQASTGLVVTYGIKPDRPETGYGYICRGSSLPGAVDIYQVARFVEKPDEPTARSYLASGDYFWNSGIFTIRADVLDQEMAVHCPAILDHVQRAVAGARRTGHLVFPDAELFGACPSDSMDYAVMERTSRAAVVAVDMGWNDVGSWGAVYDISAKDEDGNASLGDTILVNSRNCLVRAESRLVAIAGAEDLVVIETPDAILVAPRNRTQEVKDVVAALKARQRDEL